MESRIEIVSNPFFWYGVFITLFVFIKYIIPQIYNSISKHKSESDLEKIIIIINKNQEILEQTYKNISVILNNLLEKNSEIFTELLIIKERLTQYDGKAK